MAVPNAYPRALPFRPGDDRADETALLRRQTQLLIVLCGGLVIVLVAVLVFLWNQRPVTVRAAEVEAPRVVETPVPSPVAVEHPKPVPAAPRPVPDVPRKVQLEALGSLSAAHMYQSYLNIGLLADGVEKEVYAIPEAEKMLTSINDLMTLMDRQLTKVGDNGLDDDDRASLQLIKSVNARLRDQITTLRAYWATGARDQVAQYHAARASAWTGLSRVMGFDPAR